uniref:Tumor necrosis factor receptor superfamily member 16-like n=1 Tax=Sinocyclocheilus rhinocerous TaxID=307959 RepID=A0A673MMG9_9TELE
GPSDYKSTVGECCPMCNIGSVVYHDCTGDFSTTCIPCSPGTFMSEPNGLYQCFPCRQCAESQGLYIQSKCTTVRDTVCDVLDGYRTKASDTECVDCASGFYSPSGLNCTKWTDCAARNEIQAEDGSPVKDVTCEQKPKEIYGLVDLIAASLAEFYRSLFSEVQKANNGNLNTGHLTSSIILSSHILKSWQQFVETTMPLINFNFRFLF